MSTLRLSPRGFEQACSILRIIESLGEATTKAGGAGFREARPFVQAARAILNSAAVDSAIPMSDTPHLRLVK